MSAMAGDLSTDDALVILSLQLEDLESVSKKDKGKYASGNLPDQVVAIDEYRAEIDRHRQFLEDLQLAKSIAQAVYTDATLLNELAAQDIQAYEDRNYALQISSEDAEFQDPPGQDRYETESIKDWVSIVTDSFQACSLADIESTDNENDKAGPSTTYAERQAKILDKLSEQFVCNTCLERHHATVMIKLPCEHRFCAECLKGLFLRSIKDETLFPPRCCQQGIPLSLVKKHMSSHEIEAFEDASIEFTTIDKTYCSNGACNKFIPPTTGTIFPNTARCKSCAALTCTMCKGGYHHDSECPKDESVEQTKVLARELGWQECPRCRSFVELRSGCYHMT
jgi:hypothetical protein